MPAPAHPAPELVELAEAEALCVFDDHKGGVGHVHPHFDDGGRHQDLELPSGEGGHDGLLLPGLHLTVEQSHPQLRKDLFLELPGVDLHRLQVHQAGRGPVPGALLHRRADDIGLPALSGLFADKVVHPLTLALPHHKGLHRDAARGELVNDGHVQVTVDDQRQGAGDGGGGHDQHVGGRGLRCRPFGGQRRPLGHAEPVLLVSDDQPQAGEVHPLRQQGLGAHRQVHLPGAQGGPGRPLFSRGHGAGEQGHPDAGWGEQLVHGAVMLLSQHFGGRHQRGLPAALGGQPSPPGGHRGLTGAHVPLDQPVHGAARGQVPGGLLHGPPLGLGGCEGEQGTERLQGTGGKHRGGALAVPTVLQKGQAGGEVEQLLEGQPPPRLLQGVKVLWEMDVPAGPLRRDQLVRGPKAGREGFCPLAGALLYCLADQGDHQMIGDPCSQGVHRYDASSKVPVPFPLKDRIDHRAAGALLLDLPIKHILLPRLEGIFQIGLVEEGEVEGA